MNHYVAGIDEAGRGPLAGPVTAACVVLPSGYSNSEFRDSKKLSSPVRDRLYLEIIKVSLAYAVVSIGPRRIEELNIREATRLAMALAAEKVRNSLEISSKTKSKKFSLQLLVDGDTSIDTNLSQKTIIKGDEKILAISAASILAKVSRDRLMEQLDTYYPQYGFAKHKGYPTKAHLQQIAEHGPARPHRSTFAGVREYLSRFCRE